MQFAKETDIGESYRVERCPVCKVTFTPGRYLKVRKAFHCKECRATFTFHPYEYTPTAMTDRDSGNQCHCPACEERRHQNSK